MGFERVMNFVKGKEHMLFSAVVAVATIGGQQLVSFFAFSCPCQPGKNVFYGLAFIGVPALILLVVGYVLNDHTWRLVSGRGMRHKRRRVPKAYTARSRLMRTKLKTFVCCNITGRALTAPVTWLAATMLNGIYYICALSEFESLVHYEPLQSFNTADMRRILATFPCPQLVHPNLTKVADAVLLDLRFQSQVSGWLLIAVVVVTIFLVLCLARSLSPLSFLHLRYWTSYVDNEQTLFEQTADQHSRLYATQHINKFFGFTAPNENVKEIRIPSRYDWQNVSGLDLLTVIDEDHCHYSLLHSWADEDPTEGKVVTIEATSQEKLVTVEEESTNVPRKPS